MAEEKKPPVEEKPAKATKPVSVIGDKEEVINISKRNLNLLNCQIKPGEKGIATRSEIQTLGSRYLKRTVKEG